MRFISALQQLEDAKKIQIKTSQVLNRYRIHKMPEDLDALGEDLYKRAVDRENKEIARLWDVAKWATQGGCLAKKLAQHFGDSLPDGAEKCNHCSLCANNGFAIDAPGLSEDAQLDKMEKFDQAKWEKIIREPVVPKDDARLIARFALGFTSPRMTALKLGKHPLFGSMEEHDFRVVLSYAQDVVKNNGRKREAENAVDQSNPAKKQRN